MNNFLKSVVDNGAGWAIGIAGIVFMVMYFTINPVRHFDVETDPPGASVEGRLYQVKTVYVMDGNTYDVKIVEQPDRRYKLKLFGITAVPEAKDQIVKVFNEHRQKGGKLYVTIADAIHDSDTHAAQIYFDEKRNSTLSQWLHDKHLVYE